MFRPFSPDSVNLDVFIVKQSSTEPNPPKPNTPNVSSVQKGIWHQARRPHPHPTPIIRHQYNQLQILNITNHGVNIYNITSYLKNKSTQ